MSKIKKNVYILLNKSTMNVEIFLLCNLNDIDIEYQLKYLASQKEQFSSHTTRTSTIMENPRVFDISKSFLFTYIYF